MPKKSITKNYIYNLIYQILVIIIPLVTTPYLSRILGAENIGIYSYTLSIVTYFILFGSLGVASYGKRSIAYVQDKIEERSKIFFEIFLLRVITLSISLVIFYFTFCSSGEYSVYYTILIFEIIANCIDISWFFQGLEEFKKTVVRNTIVKLISLMCIFIFIKNENDLNKYFIIYVVSNVLGNLSLWMNLKKYVVKIKIKDIKIFKHLKATIGLFIPQIATEIYTVLDKSMIGTIVPDKAEVGYYEQAQKIVKLLLTLATSLGTVMAPRMANTYAKGDNKKIKEYMMNSFTFIMFLVFPLMLGITSVANKFVPIYYGNGYDKVADLIIVISPILVAIGLSNVIGTQYLLPTGQEKKYTISVVTGAIVNLILNSLLIKNMASIGASIATVIAEFTVTGVQFYIIRKEIKITDIIKISYKYIIASVIMFFVSIGIGKLFENDIISIITQVCVSAMIYCLILILLKDKMIFKIRDKVKKKIFST